MSIAIFCGAGMGHDPIYGKAASVLGKTLAERGVEIVYGGGQVGLMGIVADAALSHGGKVTGVMPQSLFEKEIAHPRLTRLHVVNSLHQRKQRMAELADAFIALPGGPGTLDEMIEQWSWAQLGFNRAPCGFLNVNGYFEGLRVFVERSVREGFTSPEHGRALIFENDVAALLTSFSKYSAPAPRWQENDRPANRIIRIAAAIVTNSQGQMLVVRKRGTYSFMQPGGKLEDGETDLAALDRELREEVGLRSSHDTGRYLGMFTVPAAHESGWLVKSSLFHVAASGEPSAGAEIEELAWIDPESAKERELAPLTRQYALPLLSTLTNC